MEGGTNLQAESSLSIYHESQRAPSARSSPSLRGHASWSCCEAGPRRRACARPRGRPKSVSACSGEREGAGRSQAMADGGPRATIKRNARGPGLPSGFLTSVLSTGFVQKAIHVVLRKVFGPPLLVVKGFAGDQGKEPQGLNGPEVFVEGANRSPPKLIFSQQVTHGWSPSPSITRDS